MSIGVIMLDEAPTSLNDCLLVLTPGIYCDQISSRQLPFFCHLLNNTLCLHRLRNSIIY
jgi:hypothetical protein